MEEWKEYNFNDITINYDKNRIPLSSKERETRKGEYRYFGAQGVIDYVDDYIFDGQYILLAEDGENLKSKKQSLVQFVSGKFWVNNHAHILTGNEKCYIKFLFYLLDSTDFTPFITGSAQPKLSQQSLSKIYLKLPPLPTQQKISAILSSLDDKIELNNKINTNLEQQAGALFKNWFVDGSEKSLTIGDYIVPKRGKNLLSKDAIPGEVPVVAGGLEPATYHNTANTKAPVLTISASGANAGFVNLWNIPVWSSDSSYIDSEMTNDVYFWYILLKLRQKEIFDSQTGSAQPHIYPQHISVMPIAELDFNKVSKFTKQITPFFEQIGANQQENLRLITLRDTLLPKLMNGEIETNSNIISKE